MTDQAEVRPPRMKRTTRPRGGSGISRATLQRFLDHLAATCHVKDSAKAAGLSLGSVYTLRHKDRDFAEAWEEAVRLAYRRLEEELLARALHQISPYEVDGTAVAIELVDGREEAGSRDAGDQAAVPTDQPSFGAGALSGLDQKVARVDVQLALAMLNRYATIVARGRNGAGPRRPNANEVERVLTAKLDSLARRLEPPSARGAAARGAAAPGSTA